MRQKQLQLAEFCNLSFFAREEVRRSPVGEIIPEHGWGWQDHLARGEAATPQSPRVWGTIMDRALPHIPLLYCVTLEKIYTVLVTAPYDHLLLYNASLATH